MQGSFVGREFPVQATDLHLGVLAPCLGLLMVCNRSRLLIKLLPLFGGIPSVFLYPHCSKLAWSPSTCDFVSSIPSVLLQTCKMLHWNPCCSFYLGVLSAIYTWGRISKFHTLYIHNY